MLTRCPHCQTCFRVTAEQLKIRQGKVRCGACRGVFDALDSLSDEGFAVSTATPAAPEAEPLPTQDGTTEVRETLATIVTVESIPAAANENGAPEPGPESEPEAEAEAEQEPAQESPDQPASDAERAADIEDRESVPPVPVPPRRWPWVTGSFALLLVGAAQLTYIFRTELAVVAPELRPALIAACELAGCTLPRPLKPQLVGIETSDLVLEGDGLLLSATLTNRAPFEQDFPLLELTLTDTQDVVLVRKVLTPADYLPAGHDPAQGFAARSEVSVRLGLKTDNVPAVGYRLYLFYP